MGSQSLFIVHLSIFHYPKKLFIYIVVFPSKKMIVKALVWLMAGILVASLCSAMVQDCDNCDSDKFKNKFCYQRTADKWNVTVNAQADPGMRICCDFTSDKKGCVGYLQTCTDDGEKCCDSMTCDVNEFYPDQKWCVPYMKDTCDVGVIKEGIEALKKAIEKDEPKKECIPGSDCNTCDDCSCGCTPPCTGCDCCECISCICLCWL